MVHEFFIRMIGHGERSRSSVFTIAVALHQHLSGVGLPAKKPYLQAAVREVVAMLSCLIRILDETVLSKDDGETDKILLAKSGASLVLSQALSQQPMYSKLIADLRQCESAALTFGPEMQAAHDEILKERTLAAVETALPSLFLWRDALRGGCRPSS